MPDILQDIRTTFTTLEEDVHAWETDVRDVYPHRTFNETIAKIRIDLAALGFDVTALDQTGGSSLAQMQTRIEKGLRHAYFITANSFLMYLEEDPTRASPGAYNIVRDYIGSIAEKDFPFDEAERRYVENIEERIKQLEGLRYTMRARELFTQLEELTNGKSRSSIDSLYNSIKNKLSCAEVDYSALDKTGRADAPEMEERLENARNCAQLSSARTKFRQLETADLPEDCLDLDELADEIDEHLKGAGQKFSALDESGSSTSGAMMRRIRQAKIRTLAIETEKAESFINAVPPLLFPEGVTDGILTEEQALKVFDYLADMEDIAFGYSADGCYARAHIMGRRLFNSGLTPSKAWAFEDDKMLSVEKGNNNTIKWHYHVTPTLRVRQKNGSVRDMVFDPALFDGPVTLEEWGEIMKAPRHKLRIVPFDAPPADGKGGYDTGHPVDEKSSWKSQVKMRVYMKWQAKEPRAVFSSQSRQNFTQGQNVRGQPQGKTWRSVQSPFQQASQALQTGEASVLPVTSGQMSLTP